MIRGKKSFTLIEMLIVIVIIGILAAALVPRLLAVQARARDSKRKVDIRSIGVAAEIYRTDNNNYPGPNGYNNGGYLYYSASASPWIPELANYMTSIPLDPINTGVMFNGYWGWRLSTGFLYVYGPAYSTPYRNVIQIATQLENPNDPDRCELKLYRYYDGMNPTPAGNHTWCDGYFVSTYGPHMKRIYLYMPTTPQ